MEQSTSINEVNKKNQSINQGEIRLQVTRSTKIEQNRNPPQKFQCKICLAEIDHANLQQQGVISPCSCTGSMKYVHQICLRQWLNSIVMRNLQNGQNTDAIGCQICKNYYLYDLQEKVVCAKKQQVYHRLKVEFKIVLLALFFILFSIGTIVFFGIFCFTNAIQMGTESSTGSTLFVLVTVSMIIILCVWVYRFISLFLLKRISLISQIKERDAILQNSQMENSNNAININLNAN